MAIELLWGNDEYTMLIIQCKKGWTWQDIETIRPIRTSMLDSVSHTVDIIIDVTGGQFHPPSNPWFHINQLWQQRHRNMGRVILVSTNPFLQSIQRIFVKVYAPFNPRVFVVETFEQALALLTNVE